MANTTTLFSRAAGVDGAPGNTDSDEAGISADGNLVVFSSRATNLSPDDNVNDRDIYVRNLATSTTTLVSRAPGLNGTRLNDFEDYPVISSDGSIVAFETDDNAAITGGTPWPAMSNQIVLRNLASGENSLVSALNGDPGAARSHAASLNSDGSVVAFETNSSNLLPAIASGGNDFIAVRRMADGLISGPPRFGDPDIDNSFGSYGASISDNGQCLSFVANGYNEISGDASDIRTSYLQVLSGTCFNPRAVVPTLGNLKLTPKKFAVSKKPTAKTSAKAKKKKKKKSHKGSKIRFTLNREAAVTFTFERKTTGRKVKGKCVKTTKKLRKKKRKKKCARWVPAGKLVRNSQAAGNRVLPFSGRIGKKKLKPGKYRVSLQASATTGISPVLRKSFVVLRK